MRKHDAVVIDEKGTGKTRIESWNLMIICNTATNLSLQVSWSPKNKELHVGTAQWPRGCTSSYAGPGVKRSQACHIAYLRVLETVKKMVDGLPEMDNPSTTLGAITHTLSTSKKRDGITATAAEIASALESEIKTRKQSLEGMKEKALKTAMSIGKLSQEGFAQALENT